MLFKDIPIQKKLMKVILLIIGVVLFVTCITFFIYEFYTFRQSTIEKVTTLGKIISANSTAALAFDNNDDASEILTALKAEPNIVAACLYDTKGNLFSQYPGNLKDIALLNLPHQETYRFTYSHLEYFQPVMQEESLLGTLYLKFDLQVMYARLQLYGIVMVLVVMISLLLTYLLSKILQKNISRPILALAETARVISDQKDYSVRANVLGKDELGLLTDAFNQMLQQIQMQSKALNELNQNLEKKVEERTMELEIVNKELQKKEERQAHLLEELQITSGQIKLKNQLLTGISEVNDTLRGAKDVHLLAQDIIEKIATYVNAQLGAIYLSENNDYLKLVAGYAFTTISEKQDKFNFGEGLVGQVARKGKRILITDVPENYIKIKSGLGNTLPKNILVSPIIFEGKIKGIIELGSLSEFTELHMEYLDLVTENIAVGINSSQSREGMKKLLEQTQSQADELEAQQEELKQTNEELTEQSQLLQSSEEELKVQQEELLEVNEELKEKAKLLEEKNEAIEQARQALILKAEEVEINSKYKSEFLTNMSHELRTPLNSVLILAKLLADNKKKNLDEKQIEYARVIYKSGNDLLNLINDILDLSKIEARKIDLELEEIKTEEVVSDMKLLFTELAAEKKILFKTNIDKNIPALIKTDKTRLEQIIKNLLSNAFKFTHEGGSVLFNVISQVEKVHFLNDNLYQAENIVAFSVSDTGIGIPAGKQKLIFEAFKQADGSTNRKYGGTGLGLSISLELIKVLGGEIQVISEEGKGSTFTVYIPSVLIEKNEPAAPHAPDSEIKTHSIIAATDNHEYLTNEIVDDRNNLLSSDRIILIIEDDVHFSRILMDYSHEKGYKAIAATQGDRGLSYARKYKPDAIILDMQLPVLDGWSILKALKEDLDLKNIPVHIISVMDKQKLGLEMGAVTYLKKPVDKALLDKTFDDIIKTSGGGPKKMLIVEDDIVHSNAITQLIKDNEDNVICVPVLSGEEAFIKLEQEKFDCVILDLGLKDMSGFEFLEKWRKNKLSANLPVIIYTGKDLTKEEERKLKKYSSTIIIKSAKSYERLLDETSLFLHRIEEAYASKDIQKKVLPPKMEELLKNKTVLLTDDDMRNVFALMTVLEEQGLKVISACDGKEALQKLNEHPEIDIVLMDMMMPEMDGYEAMRQIRKQPKYKNIPVLALTAKAMSGDMEDCVKAGASDYISKPINIDQLLSLMRVWLYK